MFATIAFEESMMANPHDSYVMENYLTFLIDTEQFDKYKRTLPQAKRLVAGDELKVIQEMYNSMIYCIKTLGGKVLDERRKTVTSIGDSESVTSSMLNKTQLSGKIGMSSKMNKLLDKLSRSRKAPFSPGYTSKNTLTEN